MVEFGIGAEQVVFNLFRHQAVTEQVEHHLFRHRQDHFQKYDYALGFLFGLSTLGCPYGILESRGCRLWVWGSF